MRRACRGSFTSQRQVKFFYSHFKRPRTRNDERYPDSCVRCCGLNLQCHRPEEDTEQTLQDPGECSSCFRSGALCEAVEYRFERLERLRDVLEPVTSAAVRSIRAKQLTSSLVNAIAGEESGRVTQMRGIDADEVLVSLMRRELTPDEEERNAGSTSPNPYTALVEEKQRQRSVPSTQTEKQVKSKGKKKNKRENEGQASQFDAMCEMREKLERERDAGQP